MKRKSCQQTAQHCHSSDYPTLPLGITPAKRQKKKKKNLHDAGGILSDARMNKKQNFFFLALMCHFSQTIYPMKQISSQNFVRGCILKSQETPSSIYPPTVLLAT